MNLSELISSYSPWNHQTGPNAGCFSRRWPLLGARKSAPKKLKNNFFQDKLSSLKAHAHYFTVFIYVTTWRAAQFGIFTHFTFTNLLRLAKASTQYYMYTIFRPPAPFYEYLIKVVNVPHLTTTAQKNLLYYPVTKPLVFWRFHGEYELINPLKFP